MSEQNNINHKKYVNFKSDVILSLPQIFCREKSYCPVVVSLRKVSAPSFFIAKRCVPQTVLPNTCFDKPFPLSLKSNFSDNKYSHESICGCARFRVIQNQLLRNVSKIHKTFLKNNNNKLLTLTLLKTLSIMQGRNGKEAKL